jgi:hypothetical protein
MNIENTKKLLRKYPNLFIQHKLPPTQSSMCWLFECDDGWYNLINDLCSKLSLDVEATQVKEKFGGLRFYINGGNDKDYDLIAQAERDSLKTCEQCGSIKGVKQTKGYIVSLCPKCMKAYKKKRGIK